MAQTDFNLLLTLDALLAEGSVARAARRLGLSPSAMSRALARLRAVTGDPLLVRAGRGLVPSPRAIELRERIGPLVQDVQAALRPVTPPDLARLDRVFTLRTADGFVENFGPDLIARVGREAPAVRLRFLPKPDRDTAALRDGTVDLETGLADRAARPELRTQALFRDRFVGVVRAGHGLAAGPVTAKAYAAGRHVGVVRGGGDRAPADEALTALGLERRIAVAVGGFAAAIALARASDLIATVPERHTSRLSEGMTVFALPFALAEITVSLLWHPRMDGDPAHRWLRSCVRQVCGPQPGI